jgi:hypothetical protein
MTKPTCTHQTPLLRLSSVVTAVVAIVVSAPDLMCNGFQLQQQLQKQKQTSRTPTRSSSSSSSSSVLYSISSSSIRRSFPSSSSSSALNYFQEENIHNDYDAAIEIDVEDILLGTTMSNTVGGGEHTHITNEYDRDNEFYKRRNEEYYKQQQQQKEINDATTTPHMMSKTTAIITGKGKGQLTDLQQQHKLHEQQYRNEQNKDPRDYWMIDSINTSLKASHTSFKHVENSTYELLTEKPLVALGIFFAAGLVVAYMIGFLFLDGYIESINPISNDMIPYWDEAEIHTIDAYIRQ